MHWEVGPTSSLSGSLRVPGDKSISHRALLLNSIAEGSAEVRNLLEGSDCLATLHAMRALGVNIEKLGAGHYRIHGAGLRGLHAAEGPLDMGNSGTAMRLLAGVLIAQPFASQLIGDRSLSRRPMARIIRPLTAMGGVISGKSNRPPLAIKVAEQLHPIRYGLPIASAQVKSSILLAALYCDGLTQVSEPAPTRDHTERLLAAMGAQIEVEDRLVSLTAGAPLQAVDIDVPGDISSAAFFIVAGALSSGPGIRLTDVGLNPTRTGVIDILRRMGASIEIEQHREVGGEPVADLVITPVPLHGADIPAELVPLAIDEFPVLFVAAACAEGATRFESIEELRHKESDRISAMTEGLRALGVECSETPDSATVHGGTISGGRVNSHDDHRIAMAFAIGASRATDTVLIDDVDNVATSFPDFVDCCQAVGHRIVESA